MAKPRSGAKKATPAAKKVKSTKPGARKSASKRVAKAPSKLVKATRSSAKSAAKKTATRVKKKAAARAKKAARPVKKAAARAKKTARPVKKAAARAKKTARPVKKAAARAKKTARPVKKAAARAKKAARKVAKKAARKVAKKAARKVAKKAARPVKKAAARAKKTAARAKKTARKVAKKAARKVAKKAAIRQAAVVKKAKPTVQAKTASKVKAAAKEKPVAKETPLVKEKPVAKAKKAAPEEAPLPPPPEKPKPRATRLPPLSTPLNKRDMEQLLTAGVGRGVVGEGSLKGRLVVNDGMPYLQVIGRDKRELNFLLQGPDQEVLPAYMDHKVSVSGLIKKSTNYGGTVDVRKFSAKKPEAESPVVAPEEESGKLRYLSPGEVSQVMSPGMAAGMKGFASVRGNLEMTGEEFVLVCSNAGTRQQVSFLLAGSVTEGLRKLLGHTLQVNGVVDKTSGWGGRIEVESVELRPAESRPISREGMEIVHVEGEQPAHIEVKINHGFTVRLQEQPGFSWAIEPTAAKRVGLREANFEPGAEGNAATREFFFTPRNPGTTEVEFFLAKALNPGQVERSFKITVTVKA
jgi:hypothetical protein